MYLSRIWITHPEDLRVRFFFFFCQGAISTKHLSVVISVFCVSSGLYI